MSVLGDLGKFLGLNKDKKTPIAGRNKRMNEELEEATGDKPFMDLPEPEETPVPDKVSMIDLGEGVDLPSVSMKRKDNSPIRLKRKKSSYLA
jgi:hypothetical protein